MLFSILRFSAISLHIKSTQAGHNTLNFRWTGNMTSFADEPDFSCGSCKQNIADNHAAVQCDSCSQWFHTHCQKISAPQYAAYAGLQSFSWLCLDCGSPNFSSVPSGWLTFLSVSNMYSSLGTTDSNDHTDAHNTKYTPNITRLAESSLSPGSNVEIPFTSTTVKMMQASAINKFSKLKVLSINCQSIQSVEKRARFCALLEQHNPDIVIRTDSWLYKDILDSEVLPSSLGFNPSIRRDRHPGTKGGGVFILASQRLLETEQPNLATDCELV